MRSTTWIRIGHLLPLAALWALAGVGAPAADVRVIANPSVRASSLTAEELKGIFLVTRTSLPDGSHVEPVILKSGEVHEAFVRRYIGKSDAALEAYYRSLVFTGKGMMPKTLASDAEVVRYVARTKGAVAYVSAAANITGVKVLELK